VEGPVLRGQQRSDVLDAIVLIWGSTLNSLAGFELVTLK
jgi:hypothetical protein